MSGLAVNGIRTWLVQRISALYMALFVVYVCFSLLAQPVLDYASWRAWVNQPVTKSLVGVFMVAILVHAWIGLRDVCLDYLKPFALRFAVLVIGAFFLLTLAVWMFGILYSLTGVA